jgi:hypothetical protein
VAYSPCDNTTNDEPVQGQTHGMTTPPSTTLYKRHRFPAEIISHCVWLYYRFSLSYRDVQEMMAERGVMVSHEAVRYWGRKFGQEYANQLRRRRPRPGDKWFLDEVFLRFCQLIEADIVTGQTGTRPQSYLPLRQPTPCPW